MTVHRGIVAAAIALALAVPAANANPATKVLETALDAGRKYVKTFVVPKIWVVTNKASQKAIKGIAGADAVFEARLTEKLLADKSAAEVAEFSGWWKQAKVPSEFTAEEKEKAAGFLLRTQREGALVIRRFGWREIKDTYRFSEPGSEAIVREAGKCIDFGLLCSWSGLQREFTRAGINDGRRAFAEKLFLDRARAQRVPGLEKVELFEGQHNGLNGIDLIGIAPGGRIKVIEFSTARKPDPEETKLGVQMGWRWIEGKMRLYLSRLSENEKINLREKGFPNAWLSKPESVTEAELKKVVDREFYAVSRNDAVLRNKLGGNDVKFNCLDMPNMVCSSLARTTRASERFDVSW